MIRLNQKGYKNARKLIEAGRINKGSWEKPNLSDFKNVEEYSLYCLGVDTEADPETAAAYSYPYGKKGEVYIAALRAIRSAAAGGRGAQPNKEIFEAAGRLLDQAKSKVEQKTQNTIKVDAILWSPGVLHPSVDGVPTKVYADAELAENVYECVKSKIEEVGGLPITIDHLNLSQLEILKDMGYGVIGWITKVELRNNRVYATEIAYEGDGIPKLIEKGLLKAFSIEAFTSLKPFEDGFKIVKFEEVTAASVVRTPACPSCLVYRIEAYNRSKHMMDVFVKFIPTIKGGNMKVDMQKEEPKPSEPAEKPAGEGDEAKADVETTAIVIDRVNAVVEELTQLIKDIQEKQPEEVKPEEGEEKPEEGEEKPEKGEDGAVKAATRELKEKAAVAQAKKVVEAYVEQGKVKPADIEAHVKLAAKDIKSYQKVMEDSEPLIQMGRISKSHVEQPKKPYTYEEYRRRFFE